MLMVDLINLALKKHQIVEVVNVPGNHDDHMARVLAAIMEAWFHNEPRVTIETTASSFYYHRFGNVLIGSTHGDGAKLNDLPLIMATDAPADWAAAKFRVWHCGHFHHDQLKDYQGCTVETHRTLAPNDAWHRYQGYRSFRDMKAIVYHKEFGEMQRIRCGAERLTA
jgi:UDP-2,3-diacylglucosamine pyrophosphatase LpxH